MLLCYICVQRNDTEAHVSAEDSEIKALILLFEKVIQQRSVKTNDISNTPVSHWW